MRFSVNYRDFQHKSPEPGATLPAFVVSEYDDGELLLYSHGTFDIWCVYQAVKLTDGDEDLEPEGDVYPLKLDAIAVEKMGDAKTKFTGRFTDYAVIDFDFKAPEDVDYMQDIRDLAQRRGQDEIWASFMELYETIPQERGVGLAREMLEKSAEISSRYPEEKGMRQLFDCLLCAMITENNRLKKYGSPYDTKLGKKLKALGVYQAIYETDMPIRDVADFSKEKGWMWISEECRKRGINTPNM